MSHTMCHPVPEMSSRPARARRDAARTRREAARERILGAAERLLRDRPYRELSVEEGRGGKDLARRTRGTYELAPADDGGTLVTFTNEVWPTSRIDALGAPLAKSYLRRNNAKALERLRALIAAQPLATR